MNKALLIATLAAVAAFLGLGLDTGTPGRPDAAYSERAGPPPGRVDASLEEAYASRLGKLQVAGEGTVTKLLPDDRDGSRHQRFIVLLPSGQTLLISHNIDLAQRIDTLRVGDTLAFYGEYAWNPKGGVVHWTHHDPQGRHPAGWIRHNGQIYQ